MRRRVIALCLGALLAPAVEASASPASAPPDGDLTFAVHASPIGNLAYQLDCLAGLIHCTTEAVKPFWAAGWSGDDHAALAAWKHVRSAYDVDMPLAVDAPAAPLPYPPRTIEFGKRVRIAAFAADDRDAYRRNLALLLPPADAAALMAVIDRFWPRFSPWWTKTGSGVASRFRAELEALLARGPLGATITRVARFYAASLPPGTPIDFDLVVTPMASRQSSAEQVVSHAVIEVKPSDRAAERVDVVCHELFHFFYASRTPEQQAALDRRFADSADPVAPLAYFLLNEAVATALGNGVVSRLTAPATYAKRLARDLGFYAIHSIDATAKGILTRTHDDPSEGSNLDAQETVQAIIAAAREAIGADPAPIEYLHTYAFAADPGWEHVLDEVNGRAPTSDAFGSMPFDSRELVDRLKHQPGVAGVVLAPRAEVARLSAYEVIVPRDALHAITAAARRHAAFAYAVVRPRSRLFIVVAEQPAAAKSVVDALFAEPAAVRGLYLPRP